jgi:DNA-binding IclR family transcriptional regulator
MDSLSGVGVIDKSAGILEVLAEGGPATLADLVEATGLSRATTHRLALALEAHGLVGRDERGRFRIGVRLAAWGRQADAIPATLIDESAGVLEGLRNNTGESAQLYVRDGGFRVCVAAADRRSGLRDTVPIGARLPLVAGSGAKVLLAWSEPDTWPVGVDTAGLRVVRQRGWAVSLAERESGVGSVSVPVRDESGSVIAALSVSGPLDRLGRRPGPRFGPELLAAAATLEQRLA